LVQVVAGHVHPCNFARKVLYLLIELVSSLVLGLKELLEVLLFSLKV
jgi:hypothetical protein